MRENDFHATLYAFKALCPLMIIYSLLALAFVVVAILGISLPLGAQDFEATLPSRIVTIVAGLLGLVSGIIGMRASKNENSRAVKVCGYFSIIMVVLYCAAMFLADGHTNPHAWIILGSTSVVPGSFGGYAIKLAKNGFVDTY